MRVLAALGTVCFAYLAVIPAAVVAATIDPACSGSSCSYSLPVKAYLVIAFAAAAAALAASAVAMALYAARGSTGAARLVRGSLKASALLIGLVLLSELALPHPVAAIVVVAACAPVALLGATRRRSSGVTGAASRWRP